MRVLVYFLFLFLFVHPGQLIADSYVVKPGDSLRRIAKKELGDENKWKLIAEINSIAEPYAISSGMKLKLPDLKSNQVVDVENQEDESDVPVEQEGLKGFWAPVWQLILTYLVLFGFFGSFCLRAGCWFALVETTIFRCVVFSLIASFVFCLCMAIVFALIFGVFAGKITGGVVPVGMIVIGVAYFVGFFLFMKRFFSCKWRSLVTIFVMSSIASHTFTLLFVFMLSLGLFSFVDIGAIQEIFKSLWANKTFV